MEMCWKRCLRAEGLSVQMGLGQEMFTHPCFALERRVW